jgi:RND family efflux transporter MFP subunit
MSFCIAPLALVVLIASAFAPALAQGPAPVRVDDVISEPMRQTAPVLGRIVARQHGVVAAEIAGVIDAVHVDVGDRVEEGGLLAEIDDAWLVLALRLRESELAEAGANAGREEAGVTMARHALARIEGLSGTPSYSGARFEDAEEELRRAEAASAAAVARRARAEAELEVAKLEIERARVRAPYAGVVVERHAQPGAYLSAGSPVVTLIDDTTMEIEADVPAELALRAAPGAKVRAEWAGGVEVSARVRAVVPEENPLTRTRAVRFSADFGAGRGALASGESVTLHLPVADERMVTTVHKDAVVHQPDGATVFVVTDGAAESRPIRTGLAVGERIEVVAGLEPGETVVVRGNERLRPGQKVSF